MCDKPRALTPSEKIVFEFHGQAFSEGREEGLQEGEQKIRDAVSSMLRTKMPEFEICSHMGLSMDELEQVKQSLAS